MTMEPQSEIPGLWSEKNLPSPSAMLKIIRAVCASPVIASDQVLSNGIPNGAACKENHWETRPNGVTSEDDKHAPTNGITSKEDNQHTFTNDTVVSKESSLMPNGRGQSKNSPHPKSGIPSATLTTPISDTPSTIPNPKVSSLEVLSVGINFYNFFRHDFPYLPLPTIGATNDYTLSIQPIYPQSLNPAMLSTEYYHHLLRLTHLHYTSSTTALRTVALGRILYREKPTSWIVVMEIQHGDLYALRSNTVAPEELLDESDDTDDELDAIDQKTAAAVVLPEFDIKSWKAVWIGNTTILDVKHVVGAVTNGGYQALMVEGWDSVTVDN
jgi:hypothetical protein